MGPLGHRSSLLVGVLLALASGAALAWLASRAVIPSVVRDPLSGFIRPGVTVWWFVLGGPFRSAPTTAGGIAFAAVANALVWSIALRLLLAVVGVIHRFAAYGLGRIRRSIQR